ncbi:hypothetical protein ABMA08_17790 [Pseudomonas yamanorum]
MLLPLSEQHNDLPVTPLASDEDNRLGGLKVLLADDSQDVLLVLQMLLEMEGADVKAFSDPQLALEAANTGRYDLIVSDIGMPGKDGHELMKNLRKLDHLHTTPSIALTGYSAASDQKKTAESGFNITSASRWLMSR